MSCVACAWFCEEVVSGVVVCEIDESQVLFRAFRPHVFRRQMLSFALCCCAWTARAVNGTILLKSTRERNAVDLFRWGKILIFHRAFSIPIPKRRRRAKTRPESDVGEAEHVASTQNQSETRRKRKKSQISRTSIALTWRFHTCVVVQTATKAHYEASVLQSISAVGRGVRGNPRSAYVAEV